MLKQVEICDFWGQCNLILDGCKLMRLEQSWRPRGWTNPPIPHPSHLLTPFACWRTINVQLGLRCFSHWQRQKRIKSKRVWALLKENHLTPHGNVSPAPHPSYHPSHRSLPQAFPAVPFLRGEDKMSWKTIEAHLRVLARPFCLHAWAHIPAELLRCLPGLSCQSSSLTSIGSLPVTCGWRLKVFRMRWLLEKNTAILQECMCSSLLSHLCVCVLSRSWRKVMKKWCFLVQNRSIFFTTVVWLMGAPCRFDVVLVRWGFVAVIGHPCP